MSIIKRAVVAVTILIAGVAWQGRAARADTYYPVVQLNCMPEIGALSLRNFGIYNIGRGTSHMPDGDANEVLEKLRQRYGITTFSALAKEALTCDLPGRKVQIRVLNYSNNATGPCGSTERIDALVLINEREVTRFSSDSQCPSTLRHSITLAADMGLQHCVSEFEDPTALMGRDATPVRTHCWDVRQP